MAEVDDLLRDASRPSTRTATLGKLAELLDRSGIDLDDVARVNKIRAWQGFYKDAEGEAHTVDMHGIELVPAWTDGPKWPVIQPGPAIRVTAPTKPKPVSGPWETAVILPDMQVGYFRASSGQLEPLQDEQAIAVSLSIIMHVKPDVIVLVGDNADFAEFGKYRLTAPFMRTTQPAIDRLTVLAATLRASAPHARIVWIAGNHEERLPNYILDNARASFGLRQGNTPDSWPVLSLPHLCRFDDHNIEYLPGYPASTFWINDRLRVIHGDKVASGGSTAHKYLATEKTSVIYGHIHRREYASRTREDRDGPKEIMAASPGCLARIDGVVPSTKGGTDLDGRPIRRIEDWQQGIAVVHFQPGDGMFTYTNVAIHNGWARYDNREFRA